MVRSLIKLRFPTALVLGAMVLSFPLRASAQESNGATSHCEYCKSDKETDACGCTAESDLAANQTAAGPSAAVAAYRPSVNTGPHGGQLSKVGTNSFEAVYLPKETRLYVYDSSMHQLSCRDLRGEMTVHVDVIAQAKPMMLQPVASSEYLAAGIGVKKAIERGVGVSYLIAATNWPAGQGVRFSQSFAHPPEPLTVTVATLMPSDRAAVAVQKTCPVTGEELGSMGPPVKLLVGSTPLFVCCQGCINKVKQNPELYLQKISGSAGSTGDSRTQRTASSNANSRQSFTVTVAALTEADRPAIAAQAICPVSGAKLGSMGPPVKLLVGNQPLYVCCKGCISKVQQNPQRYLQKVSHVSTADAVSPGNDANRR